MRYPALLALIVVALISAYFAFVVVPADVGIPFDDSVVHGLSLFLLTLLTAAAFPAMRLWTIVLVLAGIGGVVEGLQALEIIGRAASWSDWLADVLGIGIAAVIVALARNGARAEQLS